MIKKLQIIARKKYALSNNNKKDVKNLLENKNHIKSKKNLKCCFK